MPYILCMWRGHSFMNSLTKKFDVDEKDGDGNLDDDNVEDAHDAEN